MSVTKGGGAVVVDRGGAHNIIISNNLYKHNYSFG